MPTPTSGRCCRSPNPVFAWKRKLWQTLTLLFSKPSPSHPKIPRLADHLNSPLPQTLDGPYLPPVYLEALEGSMSECLSIWACLRDRQTEKCPERWNLILPCYQHEASSRFWDQNSGGESIRPKPQWLIPISPPPKHMYLHEGAQACLRSELWACKFCLV